MSLVMVNGISTSGKSTIASKLIERGYEAYDTERYGISAWFNKRTGERAAEFGQVPERTKAWMDQHEWRMDIEWIREKAAAAAHKTIYICGGAANDADVRQLCGQAIWLQTDETTIRARINNPRDHTYGTKPHELARILEDNKRQEKTYKQHGALMINARRLIDEVVDEIILKTA